MTEPYYEDSRVKLWHGDCLDVLRTLPDASVDSVVTDPPYGLREYPRRMVEDTLRAWLSGDRAYVPGGSGGFMGRDWDKFVPPPAAWDECFRVLKPGGHLLAFSGTRTFDLMAMSIRLAGLTTDTSPEVRDSIAWLYGSGFPKSLDVSKAIDKGSGQNRARQLDFTAWMRSTGITAETINEATGTRMASHYLTDKQQPAIATADLFDLLRPHLPEVPERIERLVAERTGIAWTDYVKRPFLRQVPRTGKVAGTYGAFAGDNIETAPATDAAREWQGWGTALKPAFEPVVVARKPLAGTVAANVLAHGTGALNVDGCRVRTDEALHGSTVRNDIRGGKFASGHRANPGDIADYAQNPAGRWPANVVLDESQAAALDEQSGVSKSPPVGSVTRTKAHKSNSHAGATAARVIMNGHGDEGGASRFFLVAREDSTWKTTNARADTNDGFTSTPSDLSASTAPALDSSPPFLYQAKASKRERPKVDGVAHPTVKPLALMRWLVRLVTPPGGTVLEPFAGSGTTVEACIVEGFHCVAIEKGEEYLPLILARIERQGRARVEAEVDRTPDPARAIAEQVAQQLDIFGEESA